jgi:hypothetical protein
MQLDGIKWVPLAHVDKYSPEQVEYVRSKTGLLEPTGSDFQNLNLTPEDGIFEAEGNALTTAGLTRITSLINGAGGQALTNTATRIGVGNSTTAFAVGQTDLQASAGASNRFFMTMDATYPSTSAGVITARATFGTGDANFAWEEWCLDIGTPTVSSGTTVNATMLNRRVPGSMGTKASGASWVFTVTVTLS